ncbi:MAG: hypothetical protein E6356_01525 [Terrisporobacter othiniensis]|uniref:Lipoprotein n=1 Tax=Terrisporobacter petrolearius TaxID=1460447 RepID=A0ABZ3FE77_9FIRM|nr:MULTISPECIES: hypothetical protein [Terrisporobacter]MBN9646040.1 hypothetical protein [Terrisporobacter glycolicus]MDU4860917.1 hypothetical protein [Terrisporobacter othiniensis]MDU6993495.1 hypothetical protein [Terrisporobacter othiniensis]HBI93684.1 hypothetical protein [Terrisporobacter hibernicus]
MKKNIIKKILPLSLLLLILVSCNKNELKDSNIKNEEEKSNKIISLEKDLKFPNDSSKNYINYYDEVVKETKDMENKYEFDINLDENKMIMIKNLSKEFISVEIEDPNGTTYDNANQKSKSEYNFDFVSQKGLYKVKINLSDSKKSKFDLYIVNK